MYEHITYEDIMTRMLDRVRTEYPNVDTREGSLVYTAVAPCAIELAIMYSELDRVLEESFADTASLEYLVRRTAERGIARRMATNAVMQANFNLRVPVGTRFRLGDYTYVVTDANLMYVQCETAGSAPNTVFGELTPIDTVAGLDVADIISCLIPGEDDEDADSLRARYFESLDAQSYGFNAQQYREVVNELDGVGATRVVPVWNGGGTVKLIILDSTYHTPTQEVINLVQDAIDPLSDQGVGLGLAPIGHTVTVVGATELPINIDTTFEYAETYDWESVKDKVYAALDQYLAEITKEWETSNVTIRLNQINAVLMNVDGVLDVSSTTINNVAGNLILDSSAIPIRGTVNGNE